MNEVALIIPSYNPDEQLIKLVKGAKVIFKHIIVINDGSSEVYNDVFNQLAKMHITVLTNHVNLGKGRALKYGINEVLNTCPKCQFIVTADADGQHLLEDIEECAIEASKQPMSLILGVRSFNGPKVPLRSKIGNVLTKNIFKYFIGLNIKDTQTGLRAFSSDIAKKFLATSGDRFEYETNMLIDAKKQGISVHQVPIETVYLDGNEGSHFNPVKDSFNIYKLFSKYVLGALSSFFVDIILFVLFLAILNGSNNLNTIFLATLFARVLSSAYNYLVNAKFIFPKNIAKDTILKYYGLVFIQLLISALLVFTFKVIFKSYDITFIKAVIDLIIFFVNFYILREYIFKIKSY